MIVIDSSVLVDMFVKARPRHAEAYRLREYLYQHKISLREPMHAVLELGSAIRQERRERQLPVKDWWADNVTQDRPLDLTFVPIDETFLGRYSNPSIPHMRAGDFPFVAIAKCEGLPLITEDTDQRTAALACGVQVFSISEYLTHIATQRTDSGAS
jgi:predicted nucleic acid-binding protein